MKIILWIVIIAIHGPKFSLLFQMEATSIYAFSDIMKTSVVSTPAGFN